MTYAMVAYYGMSKKIGPMSFYDSTGSRDTFTKPYSEHTAIEIDNEVRRILEEAYARAKEIIEKNNDKINEMADLLLEKETIYAEDIEAILGESAQSLKNKSQSNEQPIAESTTDKDNNGATIEPEPAISPATKDLVNNL
jgi:cell division protease FtsH